MGLARDNFKNFWDHRFSRHAIVLMPGDFYVAHEKGEVIVTTLGSCVSACIRDKRSGIGGMNHFLLPRDLNAAPKDVKSWMFEYDNKSSRYGSVAMELLINEIVKMGGQRTNFEAKIFGGSNLGIKSTSTMSVGNKNVAFVKEYLHSEGIPVIGEDVGNSWPLKIYYIPEIGKTYVKQLKNADNENIVKQENNYSKELENKDIKGSIIYLD